LVELYIGNKKITSLENEPAYFIGEIGINHNGSLSTAKKLIDQAANLGVNAVKFQKRTPEICVPEKVRNRFRETPWGEMTYFDYKKKIEFNKEEYDIINKYCKEKGIQWSASCWDIPSLEFIEQYDVPFHKIPSAKLTDKELLEKYKSTGKTVLLSVGMSTQEEIEKAVDFFGKDYPLAILHCNSGYPAKHTELNLRYIKELRKKFPNNLIGYSGHEEGIAATIVAATLGARIIERHITLDRSMWGTDQAASLEFGGVRRIIRDLHKLPLWLGDGIKRVTPEEEKIKEKLRDKETL